MDKIKIFIEKLFYVILPLGKKKLAFVLMLILCQSFFQALSIFSIMPFLSLATYPEHVKNSHFGQKILQMLPEFISNDIVLYSGLLTIVLLVSSNFINGITDYYRTKYGHDASVSIGSYLLQSYLSQSYVFHLKHNPAELVKRVMSDIHLFTSCVLMPFLFAFSKVFNVLVMSLLLVLVEPVVFISSLVFFSVFLFLSYLYFNRKIVVGSAERKIHLTEQYQSAHQALTGVKTVFIHNAKGYFNQKYRKSYSKIAGLDTYLSVAMDGPRYIMEAVAFSSIVIIVLVINANGQTMLNALPVLTLFVMASYRILPGLQVLYGQITKLQSNLFALDLIYDDCVSFSAVDSSRKVSEPTDISIFNEEIVFDSVCYSYPEADAQSLSNLTLRIRKGSKIGVIGTSGAGKSTFIDVLIGLLHPQQGAVLIDGIPLNKENVLHWQKSIGYVPQDIFLVDDTIRKNIAFGEEEYHIDESRLYAAAKTAQIHDFIMHELPAAYDTLCGERGVRLSGGQRQRIALARALYHQPKVLVFDEATSALDNETERNLIAAIEELPSHFTVIMVAHRLSTVKNCDQIFLFQKGKVKESGTFSELFKEANSAEVKSVEH